MSAPSGIASGLKQPIAQHQGGPKGTNFAAILKPSLVLDDSCLVNRDHTNWSCEVLQFSSINNLQPYGEHPGKFQAYRKREGCRASSGEPSNVKEVSAAPFNIYGLLDNIITKRRTTYRHTYLLIHRVSLLPNDIQLSRVFMEDTYQQTLLSPVGSKPIHGSIREVLCWNTLRHESRYGVNPLVGCIILVIPSMGFDDMVSTAWNSLFLMIIMVWTGSKKKLQMLKKEIRSWVAVHKRKQSGRLIDIQEKLSGIDHILDQGGVSDEILLSRMELTKQMQDIKSTAVRDQMQKAKIQWAVEGDENSKFFHGPCIVKRKVGFTYHQGALGIDENGLMSLIVFPSRLTADQISDLEKPVSSDEIRKAVWSCGENKSPGPDGFTFEFFRKYWDSIGPDMCVASGSQDRMASVLVNGSPTSEFQFHCGLKQGDPLAPYLFILVMESLHLSVSRTVKAGIFTGIKIDYALSISHLFYADDAYLCHAWFFFPDTLFFPLFELVSINREVSALNFKAWDLNGDGDFCVKDARDLVDEVLLPKENVATRWIKTIPIKVNVFAWKLHLNASH
ncbi:RNA-directed DNA polymerase, eukaryota [Tanacetum coccineum]